jgi:hypothetical protein
MEIKNNEAKESFVSDLRDAPFNKIEPERDITLEEAMKILDRYRRPPHEEFPRDQGTMKFPRPSEENSYNESYGLGKDGIRREKAGCYENQGIQTIFDARRVP